MKNENDESKKLLLGLLIGGIVGAGALYYIRSTHNRNIPVLKKIGKTISEVGEMLEHCSLEKGVEAIEEKIPKGGDIINNLTDWVESGLTLWKQFKKG